MIRYEIKTGNLWLDNTLIGQGYSGHNTDTLKALNNPLFEGLKGIGPIPKGLYDLGTWEDFHPHLGKIVVPLIPHPTNVTYGRSGFFIHGDNKQMDHTASDGCIILSKDLRQKLRDSGQTLLTVF